MKYIKIIWYIIIYVSLNVYLNMKCIIKLSCTSLFFSSDDFSYVPTFNTKLEIKI